VAAAAAAAAVAAAVSQQCGSTSDSCAAAQRMQAAHNTTQHAVVGADRAALPVPRRPAMSRSSGSSQQGVHAHTVTRHV
jgi:hypothetical protein